MIPSYPKTPHWPESLTVHRDDQYHRDPSHFLDKPVVITEKLDGGVTQFAGHRVYARSSGEPTHEPWFDYVKSVTLPKLHSLPPHMVLIGEDLYAVHSIEYDVLPDSFFLFHVLDREIGNIGKDRTENDRFWAWNAVKALAGIYDLQLTPVVYEGSFTKTTEITEFFNDMIGKPSVFGPTREGFVMRLANNFAFEDFGRNVCKFVRANHVQTTEHWKTHWKPARISQPNK